MTLAADRASAEMLKDALVDLDGNEAYQLMTTQVSLVLAQSRRSLEKTQEHAALLNIQGQVKAFERSLGMRRELIRRLDNEIAGEALAESDVQL